jgi:hypothetical protein
MKFSEHSLVCPVKLAFPDLQKISIILGLLRCRILIFMQNAVYCTNLLKCQFLNILKTTCLSKTKTHNAAMQWDENGPKCRQN